MAYQLLRSVSADDAYANLVLPALITERGLSGRDAALATELGYGSLRATGTLDQIVAACLDRPLAEVDAPVRDLLRLGSYQALRTRIPPHAAVATTVDLARATGNGRAAGFLNAVLRKVSVSDWDTWTRRLGAGRSRWSSWRCGPHIRTGSPRRSPTRWAVTSPRPRPRSPPTTCGRRRTWWPGPAWSGATSWSPPLAARPGRTRRMPCGSRAAIPVHWPRFVITGPASRTKAASCARWRSPARH